MSRAKWRTTVAGAAAAITGWFTFAPDPESGKPVVVGVVVAHVAVVVHVVAVVAHVAGVIPVVVLQSDFTLNVPLFYMCVSQLCPIRHANRDPDS